MKSKITTLNFSVLFLLVFALPIQAQDNSNGLDLITMNLVGILDDNSGPNTFYEGEMTLKTGETITGYFSLNNPQKKDYVVLFENEDASKQQYYCSDEFKEVKLYNDEATFTKFDFIKEDGKLYRQVYNNENNVIVYDTATSPFEGKLLAEVIINLNDDLINTWSFWSSGPKHDLIRYIRKRDGVRYKRSEFKSLEDIFERL